MTFLDTWYTKLSTWYLSRPLYLRVLCVGLIAIIVVLFLLRFFVNGISDDYKPEVVKDIPPDPSTVLDNEEQTKADLTSGLKKQLLQQVRERELDKQKFEQQVVAISEAETMEELHALREKFNL